RQQLYKAVGPPTPLPQTPHPAQLIQSALRRPGKVPEDWPVGLFPTVLIASPTTRRHALKAGSETAPYPHLQRLAVAGGGWSAHLPPQQLAPQPHVRQPPATTNNRQPEQAE